MPAPFSLLIVERVTRSRPSAPLLRAMLTITVNMSAVETMMVIATSFSSFSAAAVGVTAAADFERSVAYFALSSRDAKINA